MAVALSGDNAPRVNGHLPENDEADKLAVGEEANKATANERTDSVASSDKLQSRPGSDQEEESGKTPSPRPAKNVTFAVEAPETEKKPIDILPETDKDFDSNIVLNAEEEKAVGTSPGGRFLKFDIEIGRGSFKTVYKGLDTETGVAVAWCELQPNYLHQDAGRKGIKVEQSRFKEEAKMLKTLQHPNILKFYDSWDIPMKGSSKPDGRKILVLITELMTSGTLKGYLRRFKDVKPKIIRSWGRQILKGLNYLHSRTPPIIHRDLKCDNIFINGTTGLVKIGDLGLATLKRSHVKTVIGTPEFMAPEMYDEHYDESVDVYAFGMCLLEMTTLQYPYMECSNPGQIFKRVTQGKKPNALEKVKDAVIQEIIKGCIHDASEQRYTVKQLLAHSFFLPEQEPIEIKAIASTANEDEVMLLFRVSKKIPKGPLNQPKEVYETKYSLQSDKAQNIAQDMVRMNFIRENEVESVTKSIQAKIDEVKRSRSTEPGTHPAVNHSISVEQEAAAMPERHNEEEKVVSDPSLAPQQSLVVNEQVESDVQGSTEQVTDTAVRKTDGADKRTPSSPEPIPALPLLMAASPNHRPIKDQPLHYTESSSDVSLASDSQVSIGKELTPVSSSAMDEGRKSSSAREDETTDEEQALGHNGSHQEMNKLQQQKKASRLKLAQKAPKEKRALKLTIVSIQDDLVECTLSSGGVAITFKFRLEVDNAEGIAQGLVGASRLQENQREEFKEYADKMIKMARQNEKGLVGGSTHQLPVDSKHKNGAGTGRREGDDKTVGGTECSKAAPRTVSLEEDKSEQLRSPLEGDPKLPLKPGVLLEVASKVTTASQTSLDSPATESPSYSPVRLCV